ncbi:MAG: ImmA/IrrE family metallo-endopeptidase, partial [Chloroflexota bacterium]
GRWCSDSGELPLLPMPIEAIVEADPFDLGILWEPIAEPPGQTILAGLIPDERLIVFNETRRRVFDDTTFLYRTVLAHELGHWQLHVDRAQLDHPRLPGFDRPFQFVCRRGGDSWEERQAHWFASHLLLPRDLLASHVADHPVESWNDMYAVRDYCQATISMVRIALEGLGCTFVDKEGQIHPSRQEYQGQERLL